MKLSSKLNPISSLLFALVLFAVKYHFMLAKKIFLTILITNQKCYPLLTLIIKQDCMR